MLRSIAAVAAISAALGAGFGLNFERSAAAVVSGMFTGALIGATLTTVEIVLMDYVSALRRLPVLLVLALRSVFYVGVFYVAAIVAIGALHFAGPAFAAPSAGTFTVATLALSAGLSLAFNLFFMLRALLGREALTSLATGRYHQPRAEERIVMFLDLRGSTALAERLGDRDFHRFLNRVFFDITDAVLEAGGAIYRYVGDEIIITWPLAKGARDAAAIACLFAIEDALADRRADYVRVFGAAPELRGALHAGKLIVGEMGDIKREIVILGDTMNTTARIEEACRTTGSDYIASGAVLKATATLPPGIAATSLGAMALRGKEAEVELFALSRRSP